MTIHYLTDEDLIIVKRETVTAICRSCGEEAKVIRSTARSGWVSDSKCGRCYL